MVHAGFTTMHESSSPCLTLTSPFCRGRGALRVINANPAPDAVFEETAKLFQVRHLTYNLSTAKMDKPKGES